MVSPANPNQLSRKLGNIQSNPNFHMPPYEIFRGSQVKGRMWYLKLANIFHVSICQTNQDSLMCCHCFNVKSNFKLVSKWKFKIIKIQLLPSSHQASWVFNIITHKKYGCIYFLIQYALWWYGGIKTKWLDTDIS